MGSPGPTGVRRLGAKLPPLLTPHRISHQIFDLSLAGLTGDQRDSVDYGGAETRPLFHHPGVNVYIPCIPKQGIITMSVLPGT